MFLISPKNLKSFPHLPRFNWKLLDHTQKFLILPQTWITFFNWPKFDDGYWNSQMILVQEVTILPLGTVCFAHRVKKEWQNNLSKAFAMDGNTDNTSLKCECSCTICPNIQKFCPKNGQFSIVGDATASPASPCRTLVVDTTRGSWNCALSATKIMTEFR